MTAIEIILVVGVVAYTLTAAVCDTRLMRLPNALTVSAFALGLLYHLVRGVVERGWSGALGSLTQEGLLFGLAGFGVGFGILFVMWLIGAGGGGDVKMMGALGAWLGYKLTLQVFLVSAVFVIVGSVVVLIYRVARYGIGGFRRKHLAVDAAPVKTSRDKVRAERERIERRKRQRIMPYGVPVALASWAVLAADMLKN